MTQIKGTFEGCVEAPAPLKLNEVFISRADSTLNTARSRAVTVNVSLQSIRCLFSLASGPERTKGQTFSCYFSCISHVHYPSSSYLVFPPHLFFYLLFLCTQTMQNLHHRALFSVFLEEESLYIVVSPWIWNTH